VRAVRQGHGRGAVDPTVATSERGIWAVKWSFAALVADGFHARTDGWTSLAVLAGCRTRTGLPRTPSVRRSQNFPSTHSGE
jgi:hypothetical protein